MKGYFRHGYFSSLESLERATRMATSMSWNWKRLGRAILDRVNFMSFNRILVNKHNVMVALISLICIIACFSDSFAACPFIQSNESMWDAVTQYTWTRNADIPNHPITWQEANNFISSLNNQNYGGFHDWRLPSVSECQSLVNDVNPTSSQIYHDLMNCGFMLVIPYASYWTRTTVFGNDQEVYGYSFTQYGWTYEFTKDEYTKNYVWAVRGPSPGKAILVSPSGYISTNTPTYTWTAVSNATSYYLFVNDSTGNKIKQWYSASQAGCSSGAGTCSVTPVTALAGGAASWYIQTWGSGGYGLWSDSRQFTVPTPIPPGKVTLISPSGMIDTNTPTYTWNADAHSTSYYLWGYDSKGARIRQWYSASQAGCSSGSGTCSATPGIVLAQGSAEWWIQTWSPVGYGPWSDGLEFSMPEPVPPGKVTLISPSGTIGTSTPTYTWNADGRSTWYYLWVYDSTGNRIKQWYSPSQAGCSSGAGTCSVTPGIALAQGSAEWWIRAWSPIGYGPWSDGMTFGVD